VLVVSVAGVIACGSPPAIGLEWQALGAQRPEGGSRVDNDALAAALRAGGGVLSAAQLDALDAGELRRDSFVRAGDKEFFGVVAPDTSLCDMTWETRAGLWVGIAFALVQLSVCVTVGVRFARHSEPAGVYVFAYYAVYAWAAQYAIDRYERMHRGETCAREGREARALHVYSAVFCSIMPLIVLAAGCVHAAAPDARLRLPAASVGLSARLVAALGFLFCVLTVGFMAAEHSRRQGFDLLVASYVAVSVLSVVAFARAMRA